MLYVDNPGNVNRQNIFGQYMTPEYIRKNMFGYNWKTPYLATLDTILQGDGDISKGIAVLPNAQLLGSPRVKTYPPTTNDFAGYLQSRYIYDAIQSNYWCWLRELIRKKYARISAVCVSCTTDFRKRSVILPWISNICPWVCPTTGSSQSKKAPPSFAWELRFSVRETTHRKQKSYRKAL